MAQLTIASNVITVSVSQASPGAGAYNTSNVALFSDDAPVSGWSGATAGYGVYVTPTQVALDFGTSSKTTNMANALFAQQPNILIGGGQLIIIPLLVSVQRIAFSATVTGGTATLNYGAQSITITGGVSTAATIQTALQALTGLSQVQVTGDLQTGASPHGLTITCYGVYGVATAFTVTANSLTPASTATVTATVTGETIGAAVTRTAGTVQYFGILVNESVGTSQVIPTADVQAAATVVQALTKMIFFVTNSATDLTATTGLCALITAANATQTQMLYYGDTTALGVGVANALNFAAAFVGRALSTNFGGSNTTQTMHLKTLATIAPDPTMTQSILTLAVSVGADTYVSLQGVSVVFCSGVNEFFDRVYNQLWLQGALQIAGFNYLAQSNTKVPQTEAGMDGLKGAYRQVLEQAVSNQYCAPGVWNSSTTFGNQNDLVANVGQRGYYIYSSPIASQSQTNRAARQAPLVQIALKEAGAMQSSTVIVNINP